MPNAEAVVSEVLFYIWDPIGVSSILFARDEYESYVPAVLKMMNSGASAQVMEMTLLSFEKEQMGLNRPDARSAHKAAEMLARWDFGRTPVSPERRMPVS